MLKMKLFIFLNYAANRFRNGKVGASAGSANIYDSRFALLSYSRLVCVCLSLYYLSATKLNHPMKLKEIALNTVYKHPLSLINRQAWCAKEHYWSYLKKYDTGSYQKVIVQVDDNLTLTDCTINNNITARDVVRINRYLDLTAFLKLDNFKKKETLLKLLHTSMLYLAECYSWEKVSLNNANELCINDGLEYRFKVKGKNFRSPTKDFIGYVECYWDIDCFKATGIIIRKDGRLLKSQIFMEIEPYNGEFIYYSNCKWDDAYTFSLYSKEGKKWSIAILSIV